MEKPMPPTPVARVTLLDRLLLVLMRWRRQHAPPGVTFPPLPPVPPGPLPGATTLEPHQEQALKDAAHQVEEVDRRLTWMRDRADVLGRGRPG